MSSAPLRDARLLVGGAPVNLCLGSLFAWSLFGVAKGLGYATAIAVAGRGFGPRRGVALGVVGGANDGRVFTGWGVAGVLGRMRLAHDADGARR